LWEDPPLRPPGRRLLANPLYHGRKPTFLIAEATAVAVGIARGALDCYEELLRTKPVNLPAMALRSQSQEYQEYFGTAHAWIDTAEGALLQVGRDYTMACEQASAGVPFTDETDRRLILVLQQCVKLAWDATDLLFTTAGTSGGRRDSKLARYFRDLAVLRTHGTMRQGRTAPNFARLHFGLPPLSPI
jgi:3-hydroxy-9,10-secoandrosta-1,3,5(10)-triene-9,17-dione monooxygenase